MNKALKTIPLLCFSTVMFALGLLLSDIMYDSVSKRSIKIKNKIFHTKVKLLRRSLDSTTLSISLIREHLGKQEFYDPFTYKPMRISNTSTTIYVYSVGPDIEDNNAYISYDPTNGLKSSGDLFVSFYLDNLE